MPVRSDFYQRLTIEGGGLEKLNNIGTERLILSASMSLTVEQASEISFDLNDPNWAYIGSFAGDRGPIGKKAMYGSDMPLYVSSFSLSGGPAGAGGTTIKMQPAGIERARLIKGALNRENITPTQYVKDAAAHCGMKFIGEDSPVRPSITRDVGDEKSTDANEWSTIKRLAAEEGFLAFESLNTLYFATPKWLFEKQPTVTVGWGTTVTDKQLQLVSLPSIDMSTSKNTDDEISFDLPIESAGRILPGTNVIVKGVFKPMADKKLLVTSVGYPLAGLGSVSISAKFPWTIEKQALAGATPPGGGGGGGPIGGGGNIGAPGSYGVRNGSNITYGAPGFPGWVYDICKRFGVQASTYPGHQEDQRNEAGYLPNPQRLNRGIDWGGPTANLQRLADYAHGIAGRTPAIEQIIWMNPNTGAKRGWAGRSDVTNTGYYSSAYGGHTDHVHTRQNAGWG